MKTNRAPRLALCGKLPPLADTMAAKLPAFELTYLAAGRTWKAVVRARNAQAASHEGIIELGHQFPDFAAAEARLVSAVQTV